jgi:hypothetical protein
MKDKFLRIYKTIEREGSEKLLTYLLESDFFTAPASARYHGSYDGGLVEHSVNVYNCLSNYLQRDRVVDLYQIRCSQDTIAIAALLHDVCKIGNYKKGFRNVKNEFGKWEQVPTFEYVEDQLPYGHGEKSVYIISSFMKLTREEALAIRWHMGFSNDDPKNLVGNAFEKFPLAFALSTADMEATYFVEGKGEKK